MESSDMLICMECGKRMKILTTHIIKKHSMTTDEYRKKHDVLYLVSPSMRKKFSENNPMKREEISKKVSATMVKQYSSGIRSSIFMTNNPRKSEEVCLQASRTLKQRYASGEIIHWRVGKNKNNCESILNQSRKLSGRTKHTCPGRMLSSIAMSGDKNPSKRQDVRIKLIKNHYVRTHDDLGEKISKSQKKVWANLSKEQRIKRIKQLNSFGKPNKEEIAFFSILSRVFPGQYQYVGDCSFFIGRKNPDFVCHKYKLVIEYFGTYWHKQEDVVTRSEYFSKFGYSTLVVWDSEMKNKNNLIKKLFDFHTKKTLNDCNVKVSLPNETVGQSELTGDSKRLAEMSNPIGRTNE